MNQLWNRFSDILFRNFKLFWVLITLLVFLLFSSIIWHGNINNTYRMANQVAKNIRNNFDQFVTNTFNDLHALPDNKKEQLSCEKDFIPYLHHLDINYPLVSGAALYSSKLGLTCSTIPEATNLFNQDTEAQSPIIGPLHFKSFDYPVYSIQRKQGEYQIALIIVPSVIEHLLQNTSTEILSASLLDEQNDQNIFAVNNHWNESWLFQQGKGLLPAPISATARLHSIEGLAIVVVASAPALFHDLLNQQLLLACNILIISILLYWLIKNFLKKYYSLNAAIKKAIKHKRFYPVYQPLFNTDTRNFSGAEVLIRWQGNEDEVVMPEYFIKEAEESGLIIPMTLQLIETAFKECGSILQKNHRFYLSFNITSLHFTHPDFFDHFFELMDKYSISPNQIMLEITERDLLDQNNDIFIKTMQQLRDRGFSLAVDDYGTGHASISYLYHYPFNYLKIDKLFIHAIGTKAITESLNNAIIDLAKRINLIIIAEGVETKEQADYLQENGIQLLQGWYYSNALAHQQLIELLEGENK